METNDSTYGLEAGIYGQLRLTFDIHDCKSFVTADLS